MLTSGSLSSSGSVKTASPMLNHPLDTNDHHTFSPLTPNASVWLRTGHPTWLSLGS